MHAINQQITELADNRIILSSNSGHTIFLRKLGGENAVGVLTLSGIPTNTQVVIIGGKTYTFLTTLTQLNGSVLIGSNASDSLDNLIAAINLDPGAGFIYGFDTSLNKDVVADAGAGDTMDIIARLSGVIGNAITTTATAGSWGGATLALGTNKSPATDQTLTVTLPDDAINGTFYTFITRDNGRTVVEGKEYFTNWIFSCLLTKSFRVTGSDFGFRELLKTEQPFPATTNQIVISNSPITISQTINIPYLAGETLALTFFDNVWTGSLFFGSRIKGTGDPS